MSYHEPHRSKHYTTPSSIFEDLFLVKENCEMAEGSAPFDISSLEKPCQTWYKVFSDLQPSATPLIILHGGPGACHDYLLPLADIANSAALVFYDQIGNDRYTHLPEKNGDEAS